VCDAEKGECIVSGCDGNYYDVRDPGDGTIFCVPICDPDQYSSYDYFDMLCLDDMYNVNEFNFKCYRTFNDCNNIYSLSDDILREAVSNECCLY
jgi:hypothetical protein